MSNGACKPYIRMCKLGLQDPIACYCVATQVLGCEGYVDFVIHGIAGDGKERYWAVELLRDGLQAAAHAERFAEGKRYAAMLEAHGGCVSEYALIDFRKESSMPKVYRPDFIYVCINQSCTGGTLIANGLSTTLRLRNHEV